MHVLPLNPIAVRLVQSGSTRPRHLLLRSGYLALMVLILLFALLGSGTTLRDLAQQGAKAFAVVSFGQVFLICILAPIFMGGAIAQESNQQTWDVMLTSPLSSLQIVMGNLFGRLFFVLALLISTFPLFAITQLFGGVPGSAIIESYAIAAFSALIMATIAITLSVTRTAGRRSVFVFYASIIIFLFATYAIDLALQVKVVIGSDAVSTTVMTPLNPFLTLNVLLNSNLYVPIDFAGTGHLWPVRLWFGSPVAAQLWFFGLGSIALILYSTLRVRLLGGALLGRTIGFTTGSSASSGRDARRVGSNPVAWRELHLRGQTPKLRLARWVFVAAAISVGLVIVLLSRAGTLNNDQTRLALVAVLGAEILVVILTALNLSATAVSREREDKSLDILLTTPIQPGQYISGKLWGLVQYLLPLIAVPCVTLAIAALYVVTGGFGNQADLMVMEDVRTIKVPTPLILPEAAIALPLVLFSFTALCVMIGLQWSVKSKGTIGSVVAATGVVIVIAGSVGLCGWASGNNIPYGGAVINAASPLNLVIAAVEPGQLIEYSLESPTGRRWSIIGGAVVASLLYWAIVYGLHASIKSNFMMTVRRLSGTA